MGNKGITVLSLFDGMSCGQIALARAGIKVAKYYAVEIDKYAIKVAQANYPDTVQLGDINDINIKELPPIDLIIGGSPCQGFSFSGKQLNFNDPRSKLFFNFVSILKEVKPKYFLLENVRMKKEYSAVITERLGVEFIEINSSLVSAQNRRRLYWTNIEGVEQPIDKNISWGDIFEKNAPKVHYYSNKALAWIDRHTLRTGKKLRVFESFGKCQMLEASMYKNYSSQRFFGIKDVEGLRYISLLECEKAQTVPAGYTAHVSNTQRYKMLGNGWTVDVIAHILRKMQF